MSTDRQLHTQSIPYTFATHSRTILHFMQDLPTISPHPTSLTIRLHTLAQAAASILHSHSPSAYTHPPTHTCKLTYRVCIPTHHPPPPTGAGCCINSACPLTVSLHTYTHTHTSRLLQRVCMPTHPAKTPMLCRKGCRRFLESEHSCLAALGVCCTETSHLMDTSV